MSHCRHFGVCGGCAFDDRSPLDKAGRLAHALARAGFADVALAPLVQVPLRTRRRADLGVTRRGPDIALGLHKARSAEVVDMQECALLRPEIFALLAPLRTLLRSLQALRAAGAVLINWLDGGPDILLRLDAAFTGPDRTKIIDFAKAHGVLRISAATGNDAPEPVAILNPPVIRFAGVPVEPPPGGFLQASAEGEAAIVAATIAGLPKLQAKSRVIELFAGSGTLSFALIAHARVDAFEGDPAAAAAQDKAIRAANLGGRMRVTQRDLHRRPLQPADFAKTAAVVLDPPYAGAAAQMRFLAAARPKCVIYVSCNPAALTADAAVLAGAGYRCIAATPIDQFPYSDNLESVSVFRQEK